MEEQFASAKPGRGHRALASLYRAGKVPAVITQNIDNLHQASGISPADVIELHGNTTFALCLDCDQRYELSWVRGHMQAGNGCAPDCPACGGYIKTGTISFGQAMPDGAVRRAQDLAQSCDLLVAIGSSLVVWPAAGLPLMAKRSGAKLVIINREPTDFDEIADLVVRYDIGTVLEPFVREHSAACGRRRNM
jgi:NAD-dependent deacetylase